MNDSRISLSAPLRVAFVLPLLLGIAAPAAHPASPQAAEPAAPPRDGAPATATMGDDSTVDSSELLAPPEGDERFRLHVGGGGSYQFRSDLDDAGDVAVTRFAAGVLFRYSFSEALALGVNLGYRFDRFEFGDGAFAAIAPAGQEGVSPWRDIHAIAIGAVLNWRIDEHWAISGGPVMQFAGEESVDAGDAFSGGGIVGATYRHDDRFLVGAGVGVISRIEDDVQVFPQIILDWRINDVLRLTTQGGPTAVRRQGLELVYEPQEQLELAFGARYEELRFRLSEDNYFSDGVGRERLLPIWFRVGWKPIDNLRFDVYAGFVAWSEYQVSDRDGRVLDEQDADPAPFLAAYISYAF